MTAYEEWSNAHGKSDVRLKTSIFTRDRTEIIVSTRFNGSMHSMIEGFSASYQTRVFGSPMPNDEDFWRTTAVGLEAITEMVRRHSLMVAKVIDFRMGIIHVEMDTAQPALEGKR